MHFTVAHDRAGRPSWWLYSSDEKMVAWAGEPFASLDLASQAAKEFMAEASAARYEVYQDRARQWRWRATLAGQKVADSAESFFSEASARHAAAHVRVAAGGAGGPVS